MKDFYRRQRVRLNYLLMSDAGPEGGRWNFDEENREPPPRKRPYPWPDAVAEPLDAVDQHVIADLPRGIYPATDRLARIRLGALLARAAFVRFDERTRRQSANPEGLPGGGEDQDELRQGLPGRHRGAWANGHQTLRGRRGVHLNGDPVTMDHRIVDTFAVLADDRRDHRPRCFA